jgi:putative membrane protein
MKVLLLAAKLLVLLFWLFVLGNLASPAAHPFDWMLDLCALSILLLHLAELPLFAARLRGRPWRDRLQVLLFGGVHLLGLKGPAA